MCVDFLVNLLVWQEKEKGFKTIDNGTPFNYLLNEIQKIGIYNINTEILNTKDYGIPQNRERLFFIGTRKDVCKKDSKGVFLQFKTPKKKQCQKIEKFLQLKNSNKDIIHHVKKLYEKHSHKIDITKPIILSTGSFGTVNNISPTIGSSHKHYIYNQKRWMNCGEALSLQGFSKNFKQVVSNSQMYKQAGNSMSINVLKVLFKEIFRIINFS